MAKPEPASFAVWQRTAAVLQAPVLSWRCLLDERRGEYFQLNDAAASLWDALPATAATLQDQLLAHYAMNEADAAAAVTVFLEQLSANGLIEPQ